MNSELRSLVLASLSIFYFSGRCILADQTVKIPLVDDIKAPLLANLDISELNKQLVNIIRDEVGQIKLELNGKYNGLSF